MSTHVDQHSKNNSGSQQQVNGNTMRRESDYDYSSMMHGQPQQTPYSTMPMSSPPAETYGMSNYYQTMSYPSNFLGATDNAAWSNGGADTLSYLGNYGQMGGDYLSYTPFEYTQTYPWAYGGEAAWAPPLPIDGVKTDGQHFVETSNMYSGYYVSPGQPTVTSNGEVTENEVNELEQSVKNVTVTENGEGSQISPSETPDLSSANRNNSSGSSSSTNGSSAKTMSWANIASKPAKPTPKQPQILTKSQSQPKANGDSNWEKGNTKNSVQQQGIRTNAWQAPRSQRANGVTTNTSATAPVSKSNDSPSPVLNKLKQNHDYNPKTFDMNAKGARFFVIKSYSEDDIHRAIKYNIWCSTEHGNKRLDAAFREREGKGPIYFLFSVNGSGHFCGMAQMMSAVDYCTTSDVWTQDKWKGRIEIKWIYVKDVPNGQLRHIRLENNENKPVTNSRDTQEVPHDKGKQVLKIMHSYRHSTSIFDDFSHYEKKQEEDDSKRKPVPVPARR